MNWKKIHDQIIERAQNRTLEGYSELHHIIPKCLGGTDEFSNLIRLTAREHFIIHKILVILNPNESKLHYATWAMATFKNNRTYRIGSREYERLKEERSANLVTDEFRLKCRIASTGRKHSKATKLKLSKMKIGENNPNYNREFTKEERQNMSNAQRERFKDPNERLKANPFHNISEERRSELLKIWSNAAKGSKNGRFKYDKKVARIDKKTNNILELYDYVRDLDALGYSSKYVINCCNGKSKLHANYKWSWYDG